MTTEESKFGGWQIACVLAQPHMQDFLRERFPFVDHSRVFPRNREVTNDDILPKDLVRWGEWRKEALRWKLKNRKLAPGVLRWLMSWDMAGIKMMVGEFFLRLR